MIAIYKTYLGDMFASKAKVSCVLMLNHDFVPSTNTINICLILSTIYIIIPVSGCIGISNVCQATCVIHVMFRYVFKRNISHDCNHQWQPKSRI
jgi:hypothetical protein